MHGQINKSQCGSRFDKQDLSLKATVQWLLFDGAVFKTNMHRKIKHLLVCQSVREARLNAQRILILQTAF